MTTLLRVTRLVLIWIEPVLYRVIMIDSRAGDDAIRRAVSDKPASFFRENVRHISFCFPSRLSEEEVQAFLRLCPNLVSFAAFGVRASGLPLVLQEMSQLRKWTGNLQDHFAGSGTIDLRHTFVRRLTHMDLIDLSASDSSLILGLATLAALTHLAVNSNVSVDAVWCVLEQCTQLQVLVHFWPEHSDKSRIAHEIGSGPPAEDVRFVVGFHRVDRLHDWRVAARGETGFWTAADTFITRKRRGEFDGVSVIL
ncbi:hypothetical protein DFH07DRAFT_810738 [Mycena maculata]|uniref:Uncharacterized protein n=1 Tax=Mycena maculata TaxID=230809 RepID=A0AAD7JIG9_9AGAR|nr:hypothetical protein DFH07DRAFT_810738 [Mycena maculata]